MLSAGSCNGRAKGGREEPPHVRGQGQKPGGPHAQRAAAKRSYPTSEVRGGDERRYPASEAMGGDWEEIPHAPSSRPGAADRRSYPMPLSPRPGAAGGRSYPTFKELWLRGRRRA